MSRKVIALGCAVVFLLVAVAGAAGFYFFVWKPGGEAVRNGLEILDSGKDYAAAFARLGEMAELDRQIENQTPYEPPPERELSPEQLERFLAVQRQVREEMGGRYDEVVARYEGLAEPLQSGGRPDLSPRDLAAALQDFGSLAVDAKRVQVAAVNQHGFSREEYSWVKGQSYLALGLGNASTLDVGELMKAVQEGDLQGMADRASAGERPAVPPATVALVEPHREELQKWLPLAVLGL